MAKKKYLDKEGLTYFGGKIKTSLDSKASKDYVVNRFDSLRNNLENYKVANNNVINELRNKDASIDVNIAELRSKENYYDEAILDIESNIDEVNENMNALNARDDLIEATMENLENTKANKDDVTEEIQEAISSITTIDYEIVEELPEQGQKGIIYLIYRGDEELNTYEEFLWLESQNRFESLGYINNVNLNDYIRKDEIITNNDIDSLFGFFNTKTIYFYFTDEETGENPAAYSTYNGYLIIINDDVEEERYIPDISEITLNYGDTIDARIDIDGYEPAYGYFVYDLINDNYTWETTVRRINSEEESNNE